MQRSIQSVVLFVGAALVACTSNPRPEGTSPTSQASQDPPSAMVQIENQRDTDMNVFVVEGGQRFRIGRVSARRTAQLTIPRQLVPRARELEFMVVPIAGNTAAITDRLWVAPGERVGLIITR